ncbi:MAG: urease accessory UreF family protein, partial [Cyanobacteria bacterium P01_H01_bin.15]
METTLLNWLQLCSPALPVGAYSYSEGIETLADQGVITSAEDLEAWLGQELQTGTIRIDAAIAYRAWQFYPDWPTLNSWNGWLTALWETKELREQSWQMGESLSLLLPQLESSLDFAPLTKPINFAIAFGIGGKVMG